MKGFDLESDLCRQVVICLVVFDDIWYDFVEIYIGGGE